MFFFPSPKSISPFTSSVIKWLWLSQLYLSPYSFENSRLLHRAILWSSGDEEKLCRWFSANYNVDVHAYPESGKYCVVNNTYEPQSTVVYKGDGTSFALDLEANQIIWYEIG